MAEKIGLQSVFDNKDFNAGLSEYMKGLDQATAQTDRAAGSMSEVGGIMGTGISGGALAAAAGIGVFIAGVAAGLYVLKKFADVVWEGVTALGGLIKESALAASRVEELRLVAQLLGQRAGFTASEIDKMTEAIKEQGVRTDVANKLLIQFSRYQLDMSKSADLARVAQDAAVISMQDSSDTLDQLIYGISTYNKRVLRTAGINVDVQGGFERYAETLGKTADSLTEAEKVQATLNAVLEEGGRIAGAYEAAMNTAGKQLRSLTGRELPEFKNALGAPFQDAFLTIVKSLREFVQWLTAAISKGGQFYPILVNLGAIASVVADAFRYLVREIFGIQDAAKQGEIATEGLALTLEKRAQDAANANIEAMQKMVQTWIDTAEAAFEWGANIVFSLAEGIIQAAETVLVAAMNYIGNILTSWLGPGSPPKVAKDLPKWGLNAMTEFLKGFSQADFDVLKDIQSPLQSVLSSLVQSGDLSDIKALDIFKNLSKDLIGAISTGEFGEGLFDKIRDSAGKFGTELVDLVQKQLELAEAVREVEDAEKRVEEARKREQDAGKAVTDLTNEYNRALRAGASKDELDAILEQINAQEEARDIAKEERMQAEDDLDQAEDKVDVLAEQAKLQEQLLDQLIELSKVQKSLLPALGGLGGLGGGLGGDLGGGFELPEVDGEGFVQKINDAVAKAKERILEQLGGIWDDLQARWEERIGPALSNLQTTWENFSNLPVWGLIGDKIGEVMQAIDTQIQETTTRLEQWWSDHGESVLTIVNFYYGLIGDAISGSMTFMGGIVQFFLDWIAGIWDRHGAILSERASETWEGVKQIWDNSLEILGLLLDEFAAVITGDMEGMRTASEEIQRLMWENIEIFWDNFTENIRVAFDTWLSEIQLAWDTFAGKFEDAVETLWNWLEEKIGGVLDNLSTTISNFISNSLDKLTSGLDSVSDAVKRLWDWLGKLWEKIKSINWDKLKNILPGSPPPLAIGINLVVGEVKGLTSELDNLEKSFDFSGLTKGIKGAFSDLEKMDFSLPSLSSNQQFAAAGSPISNVSNITSNSISLQMTNQIGSEMDMAVFESRVNQVLVKLLT